MKKQNHFHDILYMSQYILNSKYFPEDLQILQ